MVAGIFGLYRAVVDGSSMMLLVSLLLIKTSTLMSWYALRGASKDLINEVNNRALKTAQ